jgi:hypothetical protein
MKTLLKTTLLLLLSAVGVAGDGDSMDPAGALAARAQPRLVRLSGRFDGSGRILFAEGKVRYEHRHWGLPADLLFDGEPWERMDETPAAWSDLRGKLDLTRAWIVERSGRDVIALESTADGFDLYLCDSPNGASEYAVTIAIPRRG